MIKMKKLSQTLYLSEDNRVSVQLESEVNDGSGYWVVRQDGVEADRGLELKLVLHENGLSDVPVTSIDPIYHIQDAQNFARAATQKYLDEHPDEWFPCGFAWVNIKPARGALVKKLKELQIGSTDSFNGGYTIWNPSENPTQSMEAKAAGARAFAKVLTDAGFNATVGTRID